MEELQALWRRASAQEEELVSQQELESAVSRRSSDELEKFKRVIKKEYAFVWPVLLLVVVGAILLPKYLIIAIPTVALYIFLIYFYRQALREFDEIHYEDSLQTYLQRALRFLKSYVRHYKIICWASGSLGLLLGYLAPKDDSNSDLTFFIDSSSTAFLIGVVVFVVGCLLGVHFYIKHLYQARIDALEELLKEFSKE